MARMYRWKSYHVRISTLEKIMGIQLVSLRTMFPVGDEQICIRLPSERWKWYGIDKALYSLGFLDGEVVYINI